MLPKPSRIRALQKFSPNRKGPNMGCHALFGWVDEDHPWKKLPEVGWLLGLGIPAPPSHYELRLRLSNPNISRSSGNDGSDTSGKQAFGFRV